MCPLFRHFVGFKQHGPELSLVPPLIARDAGKALFMLAMYPAETQHSVPEVKNTCWNFEWFLPQCPSCVFPVGSWAYLPRSLHSLCPPPPGPVDSTVLHMSVIHCLSVNDSYD